MVELFVDSKRSKSIRLNPGRRLIAQSGGNKPAEKLPHCTALSLYSGEIDALLISFLEIAALHTPKTDSEHCTILYIH